MAQITVSEGLGLLKTLRQRFEDLKSMREENSHREKRFYGANADKMTEKVPVYSVKKLDQTVNRLAMQIRLLDNVIKKHNAVTPLDGFEWDDSILGVIETEDAPASQ